MTESFIKFGNSFVASTSDFWHHPVWKMAFGASVANLMTNGYQFKNGLFLAVSQTTLPNAIAELGVQDTVPVLHRCQALLDFCSWMQVKSGELIGYWLEDCHKAVGCKPNYIASHIVDGAANAGKSVQCLQWNTGEDRSQKIIADGCDAHKINTATSLASGASKHVNNANPSLGAALALLHFWLGRFSNFKAYQDVLDHVRKENGREKTPRVQSSVVTRWNSSFDETSSANTNQHDLNIAIHRLVAPGGVVEKMRSYDETENEAMNKTPISHLHWDLFAQYEGGMLPMKRYSMACQTAKVIVHEELFWARSTIQELQSPYFVMHENISASSRVTDLTAVRVLLLLCDMI